MEGNLCAFVHFRNLSSAFGIVMGIRQLTEYLPARHAMAKIVVLWIGLYDLANSLGLPGQMDHPQIQAAIDRVLAVCRAQNKVPAVLVTSIDEGRAQLARGFRLVAFGGDVWIYQTALKAGLAALRAP